jgi:hypothetical protein
MDRSHNRCGALTAILLLGMSIVLNGRALAASNRSSGQAFASKEAAVQALMQAIQGGDNNAILKILGPGAKPVVSSGDAVADKAARDRITNAYDQMHRFVTEDDGRVFLYLGANNWPMAIPLVERRGKWYFDTAYGKQEILARRIGDNELNAIQVCEAIVQAQQQYSSQLQTGEDAKQFAQKFRSDEGKHNGLFWKAAAGESPSPLGPLIISASAEGYRHGTTAGKLTPYHGYIYRILKEQGKHAPGGARSYVQHGKMTGGFAVVAYPASYRSSGVMTFMAGQDGVVYQKDLGRDTSRIAASTKAYDPNSSWQPVPQEDEEQNAATDQE